MALKMLIVAVLSFCIITNVAAQGNASAPSPVIAPAPSPAKAPKILYNLTWPPEEQKALKDMIQEWSKTNTDINGLLTGWSETELNPCESIWEGIVCTFDILNKTDNGNGTQTWSYNISVIGLSITNTELTGILPPAIGSFSNLVYIVITGNPGLSGPIPKELSALNRNLQILDLHGNSFNGSIPMELGAIENLYDMDLSQNNLTGPIPRTLSNLTYLTLLQLSRNHLNGSIPGFGGDGSGLGNLSYLVSLNIMENDLTGGLPNFRDLPKLQYVNVSHNQLSGPVILNSHFNISAQRPLRSLDLSFNSFSGPIPNAAILNNTLQQLVLSNNQFDSTTVPLWLSSFKDLKTLGLANTSLTGAVPTFLFDMSLPNLALLQLERNNFEGELDLNSFRVEGTPLKMVNLTDNNITKVAYLENLLSSQNVRFLLEGNPYCKSQLNMTLEKYFFCRNSTDSVTVISSIDRYRTVIISTSVIVSVTFLLVAVVAIFFCLRSRRERKLYYEQIQEEFARKHVQPTLYAYSELRSATREFHSDMKLGQGAFGVVYKGVQGDGTELAVKDLTGQTSQQGLDDFLNEVVLITGVRHRNLVKLKGCCLKDDRRLLVYEYVENNNLAEVLFEGVGEHNLTWSVRHNMCLGVAQGLHYLHESAQPRIIHRDIKAPNILLDKNLHPKIADFGLARLFPDEESHITTLHVAGTMGYMAPEYASRGQLTEKADVYSFGVVVLEIVSGRRNIEPKLAIEDTYLIELAWRLHDQGTLLDIVDATLNITSHEEEVSRVLNVALLCVQSTGQRRPSMARVVSMLKGEVEIEAVTRQQQLSVPEYHSFMAAAQSGSEFAMTAIAERDEVVEDEKPLLVVPASSSSRPSSVVELTAIRPR